MTDENPSARRDDIDGRGAASCGSQTGHTDDRYTVGIVSSVSPADIEELKDAAIAVEIRLGRFGTVVTGTFPGELRETLQSDNRIQYVEPDHRILAPATPTAQRGTEGHGRASYHRRTAKTGVEHIGADIVHTAGLTGDDATVAVLGTGIDSDRARVSVTDGNAFGTTRTEREDTARQPDWPADAGRETVARRLIAADGEGESAVGVAPDADVLAASGREADPKTTVSSLARSITVATDRGADVISIVAGTPQNASALRDACQYAHSENVIVVAAAGVESAREDSVVYPAAFQTVIAVNSPGRSRRANTTDRNPDPELAAPATALVSAGESDSGYETESNPAYAAAHVAGVATLCVAETSLVDTDAIQHHLLATAEQRTVPGESHDSRFVDASNAVLLDEQWETAVDIRPQHGGPAVGMGRVFVTGLDGTLYALSLADGSPVWVHGGDTPITKQPPTLDDGKVYVTRADGGLTALDATAGTPTVEWTVETAAPLQTAPTARGGVVYVGSTDGQVLAFDDTRDGTLVWTADVETPIVSTPAVDGETVYVTTANGQTVAVDGARGSERWRCETTRAADPRGPVVGDGLVYVSADKLYALDPLRNGAVRWEHSAGEIVSTRPVYDPSHGQVVVGSRLGTVAAFDARCGTMYWTVDVGSPVTCPPAVTGDWIQVGADDGTTSLLDGRDGTLLAQRTVGDLQATPTVHEGGTIVTTWDGTVAAFDNVRP